MKIDTKLKTDNWDKHWNSLTNKNDINPGQFLRHNFIKKTIIKSFNFPKIMDFGSGNGQMLLNLSEKINFKKIYGIENSINGVNYCKKYIKGIFLQEDLTKQNLNKKLEERFDIITCCDVLEHVDKPVNVIDNAFDLLEKNGKFLITVPGGPMTAFDKSIGHRFHYSKVLLESLLSKSKFSSFEVFTIGFPFFNLYRLMLLLRGSKLVNDLNNKNLSFFSKLIMQIVGRLFILLFKLNLKSSNLGWQVVAICKR